MAGEIDASQRATIGIHIEQLEQKRQRLSQLDTDINIADLFEKLEDLEEDILESKLLQCNVAEQICRAYEITQATSRCGIITTQQPVCYGTDRATLQFNPCKTAVVICRILRKQLSIARSSATEGVPTVPTVATFQY